AQLASWWLAEESSPPPCSCKPCTSTVATAYASASHQRCTLKGETPRTESAGQHPCQLRDGIVQTLRNHRDGAMIRCQEANSVTVCQTPFAYAACCQFAS